MELLSQSEQKLLLLQEELQGKDLAAIMKEMEEEEVRRRGRGGEVGVRGGRREGHGCHDGGEDQR